MRAGYNFCAKRISTNFEFLSVCFRPFGISVCRLRVFIILSLLLLVFTPCPNPPGYTAPMLLPFKPINELKIFYASECECFWNLLSVCRERDVKAARAPWPRCVCLLWELLAYFSLAAQQIEFYFDFFWALLAERKREVEEDVPVICPKLPFLLGNFVYF